MSTDPLHMIQHEEPDDMGELVPFRRRAEVETPIVEGSAVPSPVPADPVDGPAHVALPPRGGGRVAEREPGEAVPSPPSPPAVPAPADPRRVRDGQNTRVLPAIAAPVWSRPTVRGVARGAARAAVAVVQGHLIWGRRVWSAATHGEYRAEIRAARAAGDSQAMALWQDRLIRAKDARMRRAQQLPAEVIGLAKTAGMVVGGAGVAVVAAGVVAEVRPGGTDMAGVLSGVAEAGLAVGGVLGAVGGVLVWVVPAAWPVAAWWTGRASRPRWATAVVDGDEGRELIPSDSSILDALHNLGIPALDQAFKAGWAAPGSPVKVWAAPVAKDGQGWHCQIVLPKKVPVSLIIAKVEVLAHNLGRLPVEVWPTERKEAPGVLDLWVARAGSLTGPVPPHPMLDDLDAATADYFRGVTVGVSLRGDRIRGRLFEANWVAGGVMGSGKSTLVICALLEAMLDPLVDIDIRVMATNADYEPMVPRLRSLVTGQGADVVESSMALLREVYDDLEVRGEALREATRRDPTIRDVDRDLALKDPRLRPRVVVIDECQALFMSEYGEEAAEYAVKVISSARKYAVTVMLLTPEASSAAIPRKIVAVASNKAAFAIGDQQSNDALLGTGAYKAGISAVGLKPKSIDADGNVELNDVGTCMQRGFSSEPGLMRCHYIGQADAHRVVARAMQIREEAGQQARAVPSPAEQAADRDIVADVLAVLPPDDEQPEGATRVTDAVSLLRAAHPDWPAYQSLDGGRLATWLRAEEVPVPRKGNVERVRRATLAKVAAARAAVDEADQD